MEPHVFGPANVQYTDWKGTVALDEPDYPERLYKLAGLDPEEWSILGLNIWGGRVDDGELKSGVNVYAARAAHRTGLDELTKDGRILVVEVEVEHEGAALHLFEDVFKQWSIHAKLAALEQREIQQRSPSTARSSRRGQSYGVVITSLRRTRGHSRRAPSRPWRRPRSCGQPVGCQNSGRSFGMGRFAGETN